MKWIKKGLIFEPNNRFEWMHSHAQIPFPVDFGDFLRIYFATREKYVNGECRSFGAFIDVDKDDFKKIINISQEPILKPGNIAEFDEYGAMPASVIKINERYYMYYCGWTRTVSTPHREEIGLAISEDGEYFEKIGKGPVVGESIYEPYSCSYPMVYQFDKDGLFHMFYHTGINWLQGKEKMEIQYLLRHATSKDGITWTKDNFNILETKVENECQTSPAIFKKDGVFHMFFSYRYGLDFRDDSNRGYRIGYAYSTDLKKWKRADELAGIGVSENGWDSQMIEYPYIINLKDKYYMFYCGNHFGKNGFGYAELQM